MTEYTPWFIDEMATLAEKGDRDAIGYLRQRAVQGDPDALVYIDLLGDDLAPLLPTPYCDHGAMTYVDHKASGQRGWVCKLPRGESDRCPSVMIEPKES
jgi:hypothetical protein